MLVIPEAVMRWRDLAAMAPSAFGIEIELALAVMWKESGGNAFAWNPEPAYRYLWDVRRGKPFRTLTPQETISERPPADFPALAGDPDQEWWAQQASWGLMQIVGAVARERGFRCAYIPQILEPERNVQLGLAHLLVQFKAAGNIRDALRRYNGGPNNLSYAYADEVLAKYQVLIGG